MNAKKFDESEWNEFHTSDAKELASWKDKNAFVELSEKETDKVMSERRDRVLPGRARALRTNKAAEGLKAKSRFIVPGHNDQDLGDFRSDAPTSPQLSLYLLLVIAASKAWDIMSFDVETAFLNGEGLGR